MHRRRNTKHTGIRQEKIRKVGSKARKQEIVLKAFIVTNLPDSATSRAGDLVTPSAILFLLSAAPVSSVTAAAVEPPPQEQINEIQTTLLGLGGCSNSGSTD